MMVETFTYYIIMVLPDIAFYATISTYHPPLNSYCTELVKSALGVILHSLSNKTVTVHSYAHGYALQTCSLTIQQKISNSVRCNAAKYKYNVY